MHVSIICFLLFLFRWRILTNRRREDHNHLLGSFSHVNHRAEIYDTFSVADFIYSHLNSGARVTTTCLVTQPMGHINTLNIVLIQQMISISYPFESPLDYKEIQRVHPKGDQSWVFLGRTDVEAETLILWPPDAKSWLIGKDPDAGRDWGQEEKGTTEDEMAGWHHRLNGQEFEWTPGAGDGQGGLACCDSWGRKESDTTKLLNWTEPFDQWTQVFWIPRDISIETVII